MPAIDRVDYIYVRPIDEILRRTHKDWMELNRQMDIPVDYYYVEAVKAKTDYQWALLQLERM